LAVPIFGFDDFEPALRWTHAMSKSSMVDQAMVWFWPVAGLIEYNHTGVYLDYTEARMNCYQDETPKEIDLFNCFAWVQMRGYREEIEGALKTARRLAQQYDGKYLPETELQEKWPKLWRYWTSMMEEGGEPMNPEQTDFTTQFTGTVDEIIRLYRGLVEKWKEFGYKNWYAYSRMFHSGHTPWFRFFPYVEAETEEEVRESLKLRDEITKYALDNYKVNVFAHGSYFNDPENPEHFIGRGEPIHRLLSAIQREFDPEGVMTPVMKKYGLF
jgi:FAD/FMN-containing dehydrogenase